MTVSTETVFMAKSRPGKNQSERSDLPCHIITVIISPGLKEKCVFSPCLHFQPFWGYDCVYTGKTANRGKTVTLFKDQEPQKPYSIPRYILI